MEQHLYDRITVHQIAAASHYSTYHYSRIFRALVGDTPKEYLRKRRLTEAAKRLLTDDVSIIELAMACQFNSQEAFTRAFKGLFNMTPGQYRKIKEPANKSLAPLAFRAIRDQGNDYRHTGCLSKIGNAEIRSL